VSEPCQLIPFPVFKVGDRVQVRPGVEAPPVRTGTVVEVLPQPGGTLGYRVFHDAPGFPATSIFGGKHVFKWGSDELQPEETP